MTRAARLPPRRSPRSAASPAHALSRWPSATGKRHGPTHLDEGAHEHVSARGSAMPALILAVILLSAPAAAAEAQAPLPTPGASLGTGSEYRRLADPCQGMLRAMRNAGINPSSLA